MVDRLFKTEYHATTELIAQAVGEGTAFVGYIGHGSLSSWEAPNLGSWDVSQFSNQDKYPLVFAHSCQTGKFDGDFLTSGECIGEHWLEDESKGSITYYGATTSPHGAINERLFKYTYDSLLTGIPRWADIIDWAETGIYAHYNGSDDAVDVVETFNTLGEPSLLVTTRGDDLRALYKFSSSYTETPTDSSGWHNHLQPSGGSPSYSEGPNGGCLNFDDQETWYLYGGGLPDTSDTFSAMLWMRPLSGHVGYAVSRGPQDEDVSWYVKADGSGEDESLEVGIMVQKSAGPELLVFAVNGVLRFDEWNHVAITVDRQGIDQLLVYVNGEIKSKGLVGWPMVTPQGNLRVGKRWGAERFSGQIDEVRFYTRQLDQQEIGDIFKASGKVLVAHYPMVRSGDDDATGEYYRFFRDVSGNEHDQIASEYSAMGRGIMGRSNLGASFVGNQELQAADTPQMLIEGDLTLASWVLLNEETAGWTVSKQYEYGFYVEERQIMAFVGGCLVIEDFYVANGWHHIAVVYSEDEAELGVFLNGLPLGESHSCSTVVSDHNTPLVLAGGFTGKLDDVMVFRKALEIRELSSLADRSSFAAYWACDGMGADQSSFGNDGELTDISAVAGKIGDALEFNGSTSSFLVPETPSLSATGGRFAVAAWILAEEGENGTLMSRGTPPDGFHLMIADDTLICQFGETFTTMAFAQFYDEWTHVVCSLSDDGCTVKLYVNGTLEDSSGLWDPYVSASPAALRIGGNELGQNILTGLVDDVFVFLHEMTNNGIQDVANLHSQEHGTMIGFWKLDDSGDDETGYATHLACTASQSSCPPASELFQRGLHGKALRCESIDYFLSSGSVPGAPYTTAGRGVAVTFWLFVDPGTMGGIVSTSGLFDVVLDQFECGECSSTPLAKMEFGLWGESERQQVEFPFSQFGRWVHIGLSYDQWNGTVSYYVDGKIVGVHGHHSMLGTPFEPLTLCGIRGYIDEVRVYGRGISDVEVARDYADSFLTAEWTFDHDGSDNSVFANHGVLHGDAAVNSLESWRGRSLILDGTDDWVEVPDSDHFSQISEELTVSLMFRSQEGTDGYILAKGTYEDSPFFIRIIHGPVDMSVSISARTGTGAYFGYFDVPVDDEWHSVQLVYESDLGASNVNAYYDGQLELSGDLTGALLDNDHPMTFGRRSGTASLMFEGQLDDVFMINKALPPEQLEKLRTTEILRLPLDQAACEAEPAQCDDSAFHHKMVLRSGAYIDSGPDGALFLNGTSAFAEVRGHEVFGASRDLFTVEFDVYVFHDGQSSEWGPLLFTRPVDVPESDIDSLDPATFMLALFEGGTVEAHVGEAIEYPPGCHFQIGDYNTWKHVMFRYDRFRSDQGLEEGELEIEGICTVPSSATFFADANSVYHGEPLVIGGARCGGEEHIGMKIRNIVLHRVWVD